MCGVTEGSCGPTCSSTATGSRPWARVADRRVRGRAARRNEDPAGAGRCARTLARTRHYGQGDHRHGNRGAAAHGGYTTVCPMPKSFACARFAGASWPSSWRRSGATPRCGSFPTAASPAGRRGAASWSISTRWHPHVVGFSDDGRGVQVDGAHARSDAREPARGVPWSPTARSRPCCDRDISTTAAIAARTVIGASRPRASGGRSSATSGIAAETGCRYMSATSPRRRASSWCAVPKRPDCP